MKEVEEIEEKCRKCTPGRHFRGVFMGKKSRKLIFRPGENIRYSLMK
jgi:hypothetical protein